MARDWTFCRQEAEALADLLEANPSFQLHDHTAFDMARELREMFGMCSFEQEQKNIADMKSNPPKMVEVKLPQFFEADFHEIKIVPDSPR